MAILGAGLAGMATALRLQADGYRTVLIEAHGHAGGCSGYWSHRGYSFDVGATTLVDFEPGGVGGDLLDEVGVGPVEGELLPGYLAWLPDREVRLHRERERWHAERLRVFGDDPAHRAFWAHLDTVADTFWSASRRGVRLPMRTPLDVLRNARAVGYHPLAVRHLPRTLADSMRRHGISADRPLRGLLSMMVEDTVHTTVEDAPLINAALGITIRGAGLTRHTGGMRGFWRRLVARYRALGGDLRVATVAQAVSGRPGEYVVATSRGEHHAVQVVSALPAETTSRIFGGLVAQRLSSYLQRDERSYGGAVVLFLGVPDAEVADQEFTHHQFMHSYDRPLGSGNNMFVSVSAAGDRVSAPEGRRAVMISTHVELDDWRGLSESDHHLAKKRIGEELLTQARRAYPGLGDNADVLSVATPRAFARFAGRPDGAVGGVRQSPANSNRRAIPHHLGIRGVHLVGDSVWPGVGTVACVLGSRIVADNVRADARRLRRRRHDVPAVTSPV
ncbi:phytoene desaturase family protein [Flexivirga aerilata]|uniref:phytoene desaturase family protein n=1 Tax=Flexivirga aerilata TaxID=1656889 RepID=UPI001BB1BD78